MNLGCCLFSGQWDFSWFVNTSFRIPNIEKVKTCFCEPDIFPSSNFVLDSAKYDFKPGKMFGFKTLISNGSYKFKKNSALTILQS